MKITSSIKSAIFKQFLSIILLSFLTLALVGLVIIESLYSSLSTQELKQQSQFFINNINKNSDQQVWNSDSFYAVYIPHHATTSTQIPGVFSELAIPYQGQHTIEQQTYLFLTQENNHGSYFIAKDISHNLDHKYLFEFFYLLLIASLALLAWLRAKFIADKISNPLVQLSHELNQASLKTYQDQLPYLSSTYPYLELSQIGTAFNQLLTSVQGHVDREQRLLHMASHELRTPIAIVSGAINVLQKYNQLEHKGLAACSRMAKACQDMAENIDLMLMLARDDKSQYQLDIKQQQLDQVIHQVFSELSVNPDYCQRLLFINYQPEANYSVNAVAAKLLVKNLLQNALQHVHEGQVKIELQPNQLIIADQGSGLTLQQQNFDPQQAMSNSGLGLYIASQLAQRLDWQLQSTTDASGHKIEINFVPQ